MINKENNESFPLDFTGDEINTKLGAVDNKLDKTMCTYQTNAPTEAITDKGVHIVHLETAPENFYDGYTYLIDEE